MTTLKSDELLSFLSPKGQRSPTLPAELTLLITDTVEASGTFLLTNFILRAVRDGRKTVLLGLGNTFEQYSAILKKNGVQLATAKDKGDMKFVDGSSLKNIETIFAEVVAALDELEAPLVLVDDVTSLLWAGHSAQVVAKFASMLRRRVAEIAGSLVLLLHGDDLVNSDSEDSYLFRRVLQQCDFWLQLASLSSQTRGELQIHRGPALVDDHGILDRSGPTALQYKLEDAGAIFYLKGLGKGFL